MYRIPHSAIFCFSLHISLSLFLNPPSPSYPLHLLLGHLGSLGSLGFLTASLPKLVPRFFGRGPRENNNEQRDFPTRHSDHTLSLFPLFLKALINIPKTGHR